MPSIGPLEILVVCVVALVVFGPEKLPDIARTVGRTLNELRRQADDLRAEFKEGLALDEEDIPNFDDDDEPVSKTTTIKPDPKPEAEEKPPADPEADAPSDSPTGT
jgi:sec-independent protein translocase protein TatB